jgi:hypothetical protein
MRIEMSSHRRRKLSRIRARVESRLWLALRREVRQVAWAGLHVRSRAAGGPTPRYECEADAWVRGVGLVSVRHAAPTVRRTVEEAVARLGHAVRARLRQASPGRAAAGDGDRWAGSSADRAYCERTAEQIWEDDGGRPVIRPEPGRREARASRVRRTRPRDVALAS